MNNRQEGQSVPNTPSDTDDRSDTGTPRQFLSRLKSFHFHSIRTRGLAVSTGLVLIVVIVAVCAYSLSLRGHYPIALRSSLQAKAETAAAFSTGSLNRTYAEC